MKKLIILISIIILVFYGCGKQDASPPTNAHEHQADGAIAAGEILDSCGQGLVDHMPIDGVEDDHAVIGHTQGRCRIDPIAGPARLPQRSVNLVGIGATLAGQDDVHLGERVQVTGVS